jgi:hypothetical protein
LLGIVFALLVIGGAAYYFVPGFRTKAQSWWGEHGGWNEESRKKDPVGFIDYSITKLGENISKFDSVKADLMTAKGNLDEMKRTNQEKLAFADKNLNEFKVAYQAAVGGKGWPVSMAGRSYSENELKSQVELLLAQKTGYENALAQIDDGLKRADQKSFELVARINESKSKLEILKTQKELVKINQLNESTEKMMAEVNEVLVRNDALQSSSPVRTAEELMKDAKVSAKSTPKADEFLKT